MRALGIFVLAGVALAQAPGYHEIASIGQLMQGLINPAKTAIADTAKDPGPQDNRAWRTAMINGIMLQESSQLLMMGARAKDQDGWMKASGALLDAGAAVQKAANAKDLAGLQTAAAAVDASCNGCHAVYRQRGGGKKQ